MPDIASAHSGPVSSDHLIRHATLRQLQVMAAIVRLGSFTRAAEELFLTQPTVSIQMKKLAEAVEAPLFKQVGRGVEPTDAGREVYATSCQILGSLISLETKLADLKGLEWGRLSLGVVTTAKYLAPELLGAFCERHPGIEVSLEVTNRERVIDRLHNNVDDLYITGQLEDLGKDIEAIPFAPNPLVMVARCDHPLTRERDIPVRRLADEHFLLREPGSGIRDSTLQILHRNNVKPRVRMQLGSNEAIKHAIVGGLGISALSLHSLVLECCGDKLALLDVQGFPIERRYYLVYPRNRELSRVAHAFLDFATESEAEIRSRLENVLAEFTLGSGKCAV